jgi:hypothetical protein
MTVARGINDGEIGRVVEFAARQPCVRGVTLQPVQFAGRTEGVDASANRLTLTETRGKLLAQTSLFAPEDVIPVPCNPDALAMGYALKTAEGIQPLTRFVKPETLLAGERSTIVFESDPALKAEVFRLFATNHGPRDRPRACRRCSAACRRSQAPESIGYANVFRVLIMAFMDATNFDVRAMKKSCVHIVQPDGKVIPSRRSTCSTVTIGGCGSSSCGRRWKRRFAGPSFR